MFGFVGKWGNNHDLPLQLCNGAHYNYLRLPSDLEVSFFHKPRTPNTAGFLWILAMFWSSHHTVSWLYRLQRLHNYGFKKVCGLCDLLLACSLSSKLTKTKIVANKACSIILAWSPQKWIVSHNSISKIVAQTNFIRIVLVDTDSCDGPFFSWN